MKYKVGDVVRIVKERTSLMNRDGEMDKYLGTIMTISFICDDPIYHCPYKMKEDDGCWNWNDDMIEGLVADEMSAVELLEWFKEHYDMPSSLYTTFGHVYDMGSLCNAFTPEEIVSRIKKFERDHAPKKMTVAEIEEQLGYRVEIIAEDKKKEE